jgi:hypothetical protein
MQGRGARLAVLLSAVHYSARRDAPSRRPRLQPPPSQGLRQQQSRSGSRCAVVRRGVDAATRTATTPLASVLLPPPVHLQTLAGHPLSLGATTLLRGREGRVGGEETRAARRKKRAGESAGRGTHWNLRKERFLGAFASAMAPQTHSTCFLLLWWCS